MGRNSKQNVLLRGLYFNYKKIFLLGGLYFNYKKLLYLGAVLKDNIVTDNIDLEEGEMR